MDGVTCWSLLKRLRALVQTVQNETRRNRCCERWNFLYRKSEPTRASNAIDLSVRQEFVSLLYGEVKRGRVLVVIRKSIFLNL